MVGFVDLWVVASAGLAIAWIIGDNFFSREVPHDSSSKFFSYCLVIKEYNSLLPALLLLLAAKSPMQLLQSAVTLDFARVSALVAGEEPWDGYNVTNTTPEWLLPDEGASLRHLLLHLSLFVWRAEKMESLLQRMQRSCNEAKRLKLKCLTKFIDDPKTYGFDPLWGCGRRVALIAITSFGCSPFIKKAYPTVVLDEFLWWAGATLLQVWETGGRSVPSWVGLILMPLIDQLHFIPMTIQFLLLGLTVYPYYEAAGAFAGVLSLSAIAWTAHSCNVFYHTIVLDLSAYFVQLCTGGRHNV